jgi:hypothetical protein
MLASGVGGRGRSAGLWMCGYRGQRGAVGEVYRLLVPVLEISPVLQTGRQ